MKRKRATGIRSRKRARRGGRPGFMFTAPRIYTPASVGYYGRYKAVGLPEEKKFFDGELTSTAVLSAGAIITPSMNLITTGTGESNRIGRKCKVVSLHIKGRLILPSRS